jgi:hypothetical protein
MDDVNELLDEILVDAYGDAEQLTAFEVAFSERARFPSPAQIVGTLVDVVSVEFEGDDRCGLSVVCLDVRRQKGQACGRYGRLGAGPRRMSGSPR